MILVSFSFGGCGYILSRASVFEYLFFGFRFQQVAKRESLLLLHHLPQTSLGAKPLGRIFWMFKNQPPYCFKSMFKLQTPENLPFSPFCLWLSTGFHRFPPLQPPRRAASGGWYLHPPGHFPNATVSSLHRPVSYFESKVLKTLKLGVAWGPTPRVFICLFVLLWGL